MAEIELFENPEFGRIRVKLDSNGNPWFAGIDVAAALGFKDTKSAIRNHVDKDDKELVQLIDFQEGGVSAPSTSKGSKILIINEAGVYSLIFGSKLPNAKDFKNWVTHDVLPSIRKTGKYEHEDKLPSYQIEDPIKRAERWIEEEKKRQLLEEKNKEMKPKADYFDNLVERKMLTSFRDTAKQLGFKEKWFIKQLIDNHYVYRDKKHRLTPYSSKQAEQLFEVKDSFNEKTGFAGSQTLITPKGKETFRLLFAEKAIKDKAIRKDYIIDFDNQEV